MQLELELATQQHGDPSPDALLSGDHQRSTVGIIVYICVAYLPVGWLVPIHPEELIECHDWYHRYGYDAHEPTHNVCPCGVYVGFHASDL